MNAHRVSAAAGVICAAQKVRETAAGIAAALEAAGLLQSPESADELVKLREQRNSVFATNEELLTRVERADLERLQVENENRKLSRRVAELLGQRDGLLAESAVGLLDNVARGLAAEGAEGALLDRITAHSPVEDPHDSPLHHDYAVPRDLPTGGVL